MDMNEHLINPFNPRYNLKDPMQKSIIEHFAKKFNLSNSVVVEMLNGYVDGVAIEDIVNTIKNEEGIEIDKKEFEKLWNLILNPPKLSWRKVFNVKNNNWRKILSGYLI